MARGRKTINGNFDYYWHYVHALQDVKLLKVIRKHGALAYGVYFELLSLIYRDKGYYLEYNDDISDYLAFHFVADQQDVQRAVVDMAEEGLFDRQIFDNFRILTSSRIQKQYLLMSQKLNRKDRAIHPDLDLVKDEDGEDGGNNLLELNRIKSNLIELNSNDSNKIVTKEKKRKEIKYISHNQSLSSIPESTTEDSVQSEPDISDLSAQNRHLTSDKAQSGKTYQPNTNGDSRGNSGDSMEPPDLDPVQAVVNAWNERFKGTTGAFEEFYIPEMLRLKISERLKTDDLVSIKKVFDYARHEFDEDRKNNRTFIWTLPAMFSKRSTYERTKEKSERYQRQQLGNQRAVMGYSNPETYASAEDWANFGKEIGTKYATVR